MRQSITLLGILLLLLTGCGTLTPKAVLHPVRRSMSVSLPPRSSAPSPSVPVTLTHMTMLSPQDGWARTATTILHTHDGGIRWHNVTPSRLQRSQSEAPIATTFISSRNAVIVTENPTARLLQVFHTRNSGTTWHSSSITLSPALAAIIQGGQLSVHFVNAQDGWILLMSQGFVGTVEDVLEMTTNGGRQWQMIQQHPSDFQDVSTFTFSSPTAGLASINMNRFDRALILITNNHGISWQRASLSLPSTAAQATINVGAPTMVSPTTADVAVSFDLSADGSTDTQELLLYQTLDGGRQWAPIFRQTTPLSTHLIISATGTQFAVSGPHNTTIYTTRPPRPLARLPIAQASLLLILPSGSGWILGSTHAYHTTNGGSTWTAFSPQLN